MAQDTKMPDPQVTEAPPATVTEAVRYALGTRNGQVLLGATATIVGAYLGRHGITVDAASVAEFLQATVMLVTMGVGLYFRGMAFHRDSKNFTK